MPDGAAHEPVRESVARVNDEVAVGEDLAFQRSWWRFERVVWAFFTLLLVLDLAGAFGRGPVAYARLRAADGQLDVHYERIERTGTPSMLTITLGRGAIHDGFAEVYVSDSIVGSLGAQRVIPQPAATVLGDGGLTYRFKAASSPATVRLELQPSGSGIFPFSVAVPGKASLHAKVLVMP